MQPKLKKRKVTKTYNHLPEKKIHKIFQSRGCPRQEIILVHCNNAR